MANPSDSSPEPIDTRRILFHDYGTQLRLEADDTIVLLVLCGRVAQYGVEFMLNEDERENYKREGEDFVKRLAVEVRSDPKRFASRGREC